MGVVQGVNVAAVTPRRESGHEVDLGAFLDFIDYLGNTRVRGIAVMGTTGDFLHFDFEERARAVALAAKRSRLPVIANVSHSNLDAAVGLGQRAAEAGATALLLMPPYFFRYPQETVAQFYLQFAEEMARKLPILIYNLPMVTTPIEIETALNLLATGLFAGIKDSSGNLDYFARLKALCDEHPFTLLVGNDIVFTRARMSGAQGVISGVASALPELMTSLDDAIAEGHAAKRDRLEARLQEFIAWVDSFPAPAGVREAVRLRGMKVGPMAVPPGPREAQRFEEFRGWFRDWLPQVLKECANE